MSCNANGSVIRQSCLSARFSPPAFLNAVLFEETKPNSKAEFHYFLFLLAEFSAASLAAQPCPSLTYKEIPGHFCVNPVFSSCDLLP